MDDIIDLILSDDDPPDFNKRRFLEQLSSGNDYEKRLLICIGIDVKNGLVDKSFFNQILDRIDFNCLTCCNSSCLKSNCTSNNSKSYYDTDVGCTRLLSQYENAVIASKNFVSLVYKDARSSKMQFSRVMSLLGFSKYYYAQIDPNINYRRLKPKIEEGRLNNLYLVDSIKDTDYRELLWTVPLEDILSVKNDLSNSGYNTDDELANETVNRLGLLIGSSSKEYIFLKYDNDFNEILYQPSHLSKNWTEDHFYLSYIKSDGFGRTRPRTGDDESRRMREKVYYAITSSPKYKYDVSYLGVVNNYAYNMSNFIDESMKRYTL